MQDENNSQNKDARAEILLATREYHGLLGFRKTWLVEDSCVLYLDGQMKYWSRTSRKTSIMDNIAEKIAKTLKDKGIKEYSITNGMAIEAIYNGGKFEGYKKIYASRRVASFLESFKRTLESKLK
jgi:hypothetical protein